MIAAEQTGRRAFLMELDPPYCDVIIERWEKFTGKKAICEKGVAPTEKTPAEARVVGERTPDVVTC
jgi:DNA modification methylase